MLPRLSCSSTACDLTTGRKRSHSDSTQLTDKEAVSHGSGDVIVESALRSCKAIVNSRAVDGDLDGSIDDERLGCSVAAAADGRAGGQVKDDEHGEVVVG